MIIKQFYNLPTAHCSLLATRMYICHMRIIATIPHPEMRVSIFQMNQKYILKLEWGPLEQAFKWDEYEFAGLEDFQQRVVSSTLLENSLERFKAMLGELAN